MAHRVNFMLEETVWMALKQVDKGERSRVVNHAIAEWFRKHQRLGAAQRMDRLRSMLPAVAAGEVAAWVREDREHYK